MEYFLTVSRREGLQGAGMGGRLPAIEILLFILLYCMCFRALARIDVNIVLDCVLPFMYPV